MASEFTTIYEKTPFGIRARQVRNPDWRPSSARIGGPTADDKAKQKALDDAALNRRISNDDLSFAKQQSMALTGPTTYSDPKTAAFKQQQQQAPVGPATPQNTARPFPPAFPAFPSQPSSSSSQFPQLPQFQFGDPSSAVQQAPQSQTSNAPASLTSQFYQPLSALEDESRSYRDDLRNNTGRIAGQVAQATGDFLGELYNQSDVDLARRGVADSGVENQQRQQARDTAMRAGAKQLGDVQLGQQQLLGGAINSALPITMANPTLALQNKQIGLQTSIAQNNAAQTNFQNNMALQNQAFQQYMALLNAQRSSPTYTGFNF